MAQTSASWISEGFSQRQITPQPAPRSGQPRPISRLGCSGRPYRPCFPHRSKEKLEAAARWGVPVLSLRWLSDSVARGRCGDPERYQL
eukprot:scaffold46060_cov58-Phaeocystis_antarctica.AAC.3